MFGMVGWGATTLNGSFCDSRKRVTWEAASVVSPGGFGLLARTKSHKKLTMVSRSSSSHFASCCLTSSMTTPESGGESIHHAPWLPAHPRRHHAEAAGGIPGAALRGDDRDCRSPA